jgi:hypothetical protein
MVAKIVNTINAMTDDLKKGTIFRFPVKVYEVITNGATISKTITAIIISCEIIIGIFIFFANLLVVLGKKNIFSKPLNKNMAVIRIDG